jgi:hypothetical protein
VGELSAWAADLASADRVWALVAPGGSGKTAIAERLVASMEPGAANVLVWSFYERPDADAFLRECNQLFLGEEEGPAGGRLERLERGLRDGRPHLIVLDGLERVQEEAGGGRLRGELSDHTLKLLLRALAAGPGPGAGHLPLPAGGSGGLEPPRLPRHPPRRPRAGGRRGGAARLGGGRR